MKIVTGNQPQRSHLLLRAILGSWLVVVVVAVDGAVDVASSAAAAAGLAGADDVAHSSPSAQPPRPYDAQNL